jgi:hypothetical protein
MMQLKYRILMLIFLVLVGCTNNSRTSKDKQNEKIELSPFIDEWVSVARVIPYSATVLIKKDHTFSYNFGACQSFGFSNGDWQMENGTLVLTSSAYDSCYYTREFGVNCISISDSNETMYKPQQTTIEGCLPEGIDEYIIFANDQFILRNDTLIHVSLKDTPCPEMKDKFVRKKPTNANN